MTIGIKNMRQKVIKDLNYEIRQLSWSKRRKPNSEKEILSVELIGFEKIENNMCKMIVDYENEKVELTARVLYNDRQDFWLVSGINTTGKQCTIKLVD